MPRETLHFYEFGLYQVDPSRRLLLRKGEVVPLTPKAFDTLLFLVQNSGRIVDKAELMKALWPDSFVEEGNLTQNVFLLRKAFGESATEHRHIVTVPGRGYRFAVPVEDVAEAETSPAVALAANGESIPVAAAKPARDTALRLGQPKFLLLAALLLVAGFGFFWYSSHRAPPLTERDSIVLADFENRTGDAAFDGILKKALEVEISQSPYLNVLPDQKVRETLGYMRRSAGEAITKQVGLEICQRSSTKAMVSGSIASLGSHYVVTLEALGCGTGDVLAEASAEAESKEKVLRSLGQSARTLRRTLGESLASVQKFDAPIEQATTSSFDAFKSFAQGDELRRQGKNAEAIPFFKRAIELDPQFALAFARLGTSYFNLTEWQLARQYLEKAYQLRARVSERERLYLVGHYFEQVTGEIIKDVENYELWTSTYPRDWVPYTNLSNLYTTLGQYEPAITAGREALRLNPDHVLPYEVLARAYKRANRFPESKAICELAIAKKLDDFGIRSILYQIGVAESDAQAMQRQVEWGADKPTEDQTIMDEAWAAATEGKLRESRELCRRAFEAARRHGFQDNAAIVVLSQADIESAFGNFARARERATTALKLAQGADFIDLAAVALARCGDLDRPQSIASDLGKRCPLDTIINDVTLPVIRATVQINRRQPARAIELLRTAEPYELRDFQVLYTRGVAFLAARMGREGAAEFQKILHNPGIDPISPYYPLARVGLARAYALQADN